MTRVTVLGASGTTGSRVVRGLRSRGHDARPASRTSVVHFDWGDRSTWVPALRGADALYVVPDEGPEGVDRLEALLGAASKEAVERTVLLSARDWIDTDLPDGLLREEAAERSGLAWTIIRPAWFAQDFLTIECFAAGVRSGEVLHASADGATAFVDADDIASVAIAALTDGGHEGRHYEVSGPESLSVDDALMAIAGAVGREIRPVAVDEASFERYLRSHGAGDGEVHAMLFFSRAMKRGELDYVSPGLQAAVGRPATDFTTFADRAAADPRWAATARD